jgi:hypothetical protein
MSMFRFALAGNVAACLAGGVAAAQVTAAPPPPSSMQPGMTEQHAPSAPAENAAPATPATAAGANASVTVDASGVRHILVASPPVPDTAENRAKYGGPLSNGGRRTEPAGN